MKAKLARFFCLFLGFMALVLCAQSSVFASPLAVQSSAPTQVMAPLSSMPLQASMPCCPNTPQNANGHGSACSFLLPQMTSLVQQSMLIGEIGFDHILVGFFGREIEPDVPPPRSIVR